MAIYSQALTILKEKSPKSKFAEKFWTRLDQEGETSVEEALLSYTSAAKRLGKEYINWSDLEKSRLEALLNCSVKEETFCQIVRIALIIAFPKKEFINEILRRGDDYEKAAALKVLFKIDEKGQFCELAIDSCRSNSSIVFSAISQNNPYPALFFPDNQITHLALKTIFMNLDFSLIKKIDERVSDNLKIALCDLYKERLAAGRTLPKEALAYMKKHSFID